MVDGADENFSALYRRFDGVDAKFDSVGAKLTAHDQRFDAVDAKLAAHDQRLDAQLPGHADDLAQFLELLDRPIAVGREGTGMDVPNHVLKGRLNVLIIVEQRFLWAAPGAQQLAV